MIKNDATISRSLVHLEHPVDRLANIAVNIGGIFDLVTKYREAKQQLDSKAEAVSLAYNYLPEFLIKIKVALEKAYQKLIEAHPELLQKIENVEAQVPSVKLDNLDEEARDTLQRAACILTHPDLQSAIPDGDRAQMYINVASPDENFTDEEISQESAYAILLNAKLRIDNSFAKPTASSGGFRSKCERLLSEDNESANNFFLSRTEKVLAFLFAKQTEFARYVDTVDAEITKQDPEKIKQEKDRNAFIMANRELMGLFSLVCQDCIYNDANFREKLVREVCSSNSKDVSSLFYSTTQFEVIDGFLTIMRDADRPISERPKAKLVEIANNISNFVAGYYREDRENDLLIQLLIKTTEDFVKFPNLIISDDLGVPKC